MERFVEKILFYIKRGGCKDICLKRIKEREKGRVSSRLYNYNINYQVGNDLKLNPFAFPT